MFVFQTKGTGRRFVAFLLIVLFLLSISALPAAAASQTDSAAQRTVRVGIPDTDTIDPSGGDNETVAYQKEYLQAVAEYANWNYTYVNAPWQDLLNMMKDGSIDVLMDVSKTDERLAYFDYSNESMGTEMCYLYGRGDSTLSYDDFTAFNGMTVGYEAGSTIIDALQAYGQTKGFTFTAKPYVSGAAMFAALDAGEVDTVVQTNYYYTPSGHIILAKCCPAPVYIVTNKKDPAIKSELDEAMTDLFSYNPGFNSDLYKNHFADNLSQTAGFTDEETAYLNTKPTVNVLYEENWAPFEYDVNGEARGITPDVIRAVGEDTGINFQFVLQSSTQAIYDDLNSGQKDTLMAVSYNYIWANSHDLWVTQPYVSGSVMRVAKSADTTPQSVAVVQGGYLASQVTREYPDLEAVNYLTFAECMDAVNSGDVDCTFVSSYQANYYRSMHAYEALNYQPIETITQGVALGVTKNSNPILLSILSKSLQRISTSRLPGILSENALNTQELSFDLLMRRYPLAMALGLAALGILLGLLVFLYVSSSNRKRQNLALAAAKEEADQANRAKSDFLSRMSHDIRTPLNGIIGMTYLTQKMDLPKQAQENLSTITTSSQFLLSLINDILDMSKAESGSIELHPEPYPIRRFNDYLSAVIKPLCDAKNQTLVRDFQTLEDRVPLLDELRMNQIMFNLLSNAVKYTPEGGTIRCGVAEEPLDDGGMRLTLKVQDDGIGISADFQKHLFQAFTQEGRNDNAENRGTGLGLAITKKLADAMGGQLSVDSALGKGSTFSLTLTLACVPSEGTLAAPAGKTVPDSAESLQGRRVLLCEDNLVNQTIAQALLKEIGVNADTASDGRQGVAVFEGSAPFTYDAVLMDIRMPFLNGYEATREIRALPRDDAKTVPIIAMTADAFEEDVRKCTDAGMNGHVPKPIDPRQLSEELKRCLKETGGADHAK
jgi:signal transduction histidine kinase